MSRVARIFDRIIKEHATVKCAGCGVELQFHGEQDHNFFEYWGEEDETWSSKHGD